MERYEVCRKNSFQKFIVADRFLNFTYRVVNEPKLLFGIVDNIFYAVDDAMNSLLYMELLYKFVPEFNENFESRIDVFKLLVNKYKISSPGIQILLELNQIIQSHKKSSVEFVKNKSIIMCSDEFSCEKLTFEMVQNYFKKAKLFIDEINTLLNQNERNYRRYS